jgi:hypothetical protein
LAFEALARRSALVIHSVLVDRQLIVELGGFDEGLRTCEEWDLWQRAARAGARFVAVCEPLAFYRMSSNSLTSNALTMVRDAADVIGRGFSADLRAKKPAQAHANGADPTYGTADVALALFTLWCAGYQLGRGADIATVLTAGRLVDLNNDLGYAAEVILDSLTVGAGCTLSELAGRWDVLEESLPALLGRLEAASSQPGLRRRLQYELERRVLNSAQLPDPLSLTLTAAVPFDVRRPSSFVPRQGVDRLLVRLHRGNKELGTIEMPVFGAASAYEIAQEAIDHLGVRTFVRESGADRRPRAWLTGTAIVTRGLFAKRPRRANLRPLARRAVRTAALAHLHAPTNDQWSSFCPPNAAHGEHDRRDARSTPTSSEQRFARASSGGTQAFDRPLIGTRYLRRLIPGTTTLIMSV